MSDKVFLLTNNVQTMRKYITENSLDPKDCVALTSQQDLLKMRGVNGATVVKLPGWNKLPQQFIQQVYATAKSTKSTVK